MDGGQGRDELLGNLRRDTLIGGGGDDRVLGDELSGPDFLENEDFKTTGGGDLLIGGFGDDIVLGGGGDDLIYGGGNVDELEGHAGEDTIYGGGGIDFIRLDVDPSYAFGGDVLDGHYDNSPNEGVTDDFATDILLINGTDGNDVITIAGDGFGQAIINYNGRQLPVTIKDGLGNTLIEQYQINGLSGHDEIGFDVSFDTSDLAQRSRDWVGVFQGGSGNDTLIGSAGRDRLDGGRGSDFVYGLGGDDRLWGDSGEGVAGDTDRLYAGTGNDDLLGGQGVNYLYAWSSDPGVIGPDYGIFNLDGTREDTGLNRMLGRDRNDFLFAGTGLDFMYGGGGVDVLHDPDGMPLENFGVPEGDEWLEYARSNDSVWYYGGSGRDDVITVDYVTEPGLLGGHHLITRLTENNGFFSFDAQVRLDFAATNADGSLVWDPSDLVQRVEELTTAVDDDARRLAATSLELSGDLLPPEGDFLAIIVSAGDGDDQVFVGPTVQKTVWVSAGAGDDRVEYASGTAILVDIADADPRNEVIGDADDFSSAFELGLISNSVYYEKLTLDSPDDVDWFTFTVDDLTFHPEAQFVVDSLSDDDRIEFEFYQLNAAGTLDMIAEGDLQPDPASLDTDRKSRTAMRLGEKEFRAGTRVYMRVRSLTQSPTTYNLGLDFASEDLLGLNRVALGVQSDTFLRRDVIVGGPGDDILRGGPSEDWVIGGSGNDIITGGVDGDASDILIGEDGDDVFQIIPSGTTFDVTLADEIEGNAGFDRILFLGGDLDDRGRPVPDHVTLRYQPLLNAYELAAKVWDTANQEFLVDGNNFVVHTASYRASSVEATEFDLRAGNDELHLEASSISIIDGEPIRVSGYQFDRPDGTTDESETYGISPGDRQVGGGAVNFIIRGGDGNDLLFGSPYDDIMFGGAGIDQIVGGGGSDEIDGESGDDILIGDLPTAITPLFDDYEIVGRSERTNDVLGNATVLDLSTRMVGGLTLHDGDSADWFYLPSPPNNSALSIDFVNGDYGRLRENILNKDIEVFPARFNSSTGKYEIAESNAVATGTLVFVDNPTASTLVADESPRTDGIGIGNTVTGQFRLEVTGENPELIDVTMSSGMSGEELETAVNQGINAVGLSDAVFAFYDVARERLMLQPRDGQRITVQSLSQFSFVYFGFTDGQTNDGAPFALGEYSITSNKSFEAPVQMGPTQSPSPFAFPTADRSSFAFDSQTQFDLFSSNDLDFARRLDGVNRDEAIASVINVGDVNADGRNDVLLQSQTTGYLFFGDIDASASIDTVRDAADFIIHYPSENYSAIAGPVDLDGDGHDDLTFARESVNKSQPIFKGLITIEALSGAYLADDSPVRVISVGGELQIIDVDREIPAAGTPITYIGTVGNEDLDIAWINQNGDEFPDLAVFGRNPNIRLIQTLNTKGYGVVQDGEDLAYNFTTVPNIVANNLISVLGVMESSATVSTAQYGRAVTEVRTDDTAHTTFGDIDGDGTDDVIVTLPRGWTFDPGSDDEVVSRTYRIAGGSNAFSVALGTSRYGAIAQYAEFDYGLRDSSDPSLGHSGALNVDLPVAVADVDGNGSDDLIFLSDAVSGDLNEAQLRVVLSDDLLAQSGSLVDLRGSVSVSGFRSTDNVFLNPSVSTGDFDGDGQVDVAWGADNSTDATAWVLFDIASGPARRVVTSSFGDPRVDYVAISGPTGGSHFGRMPTSAIDVTGDRIDDLLIGASGFDTDGGAIDGGAVYVIAGSHRIIGTPDESLVVDLSNDSVRGIGDVVRDSQGDVNVDSVLAKQVDTDWYRFRLVGDGQIGDRIRISPPALSTTETRVRDVAGQFGPGNSVYNDTPTFDVNEDGTDGVLEFDVESLLQAYDDSSVIAGASLRLQGSATSSAETSEALTRPEHLTPIPGKNGASDLVYFTGGTEATGRELYVTDGTASGTRLVYETLDGPESYYIDEVTSAGDTVFFNVNYPGDGEVYDRRFFMTDGTKTFEVTSDDGEELVLIYGSFEDELYVIRSYDKPQLFKVQIENDGSGTFVQVGDLQRDDYLYDTSFAVVEDGFYFQVDEQLWKSDGTDAGTVLLKSFDSIGTSFTYFTPFAGNGIVFAADDGSGMRLWISDASGNTYVLSTTIDPTKIENLVDVDGTLFFNIGSELYLSDGTDSGTKFTRQLSSTAFTGSGRIDSLEINKKLVSIVRLSSEQVLITVSNTNGEEVSSATLSADSSVHVNGFGKWDDQLVVGYQTHDGPGQGFKHFVDLMDLDSGSLTNLATEIDDNYVGDFTNFVQSGDLKIFEGYRSDNILGNELWVSDLTAAGTQMLAQTGGGSGSEGGVITLRFSGGRNDMEITGDERDETVVFAMTATFPSTTALVDIDLTPYVEQLRSLFDQGYRSIVATMSMSSGEATIIDPFDGNNTGLYFEKSGGMIGQLIDSEGRLIASDFSSYDLRNLPAGEYYVGVSRAPGRSIDSPADYSLEIDPPGLGSAHATESNDVLRGGDGDDIVAGGPGNDRIVGDSGDDVLIGELFEFVDATSSDVTRGDLTSSPYAETRSERQLRDPIAAIGVDVNDLGIGEINIGNPEIAERIADQLGVTIQTLVDGSMKFSRPVTATDLAGITELDLSLLGLDDIVGVEHLVGLESLDLGNNNLASNDLAVLRPAAAGARGLSNLRYLNLEGNRLVALGNLNSLTSLRALNLSRQRDLAITNVNPLSVLDQLVFLSVAGNQVEDLSPLSNLTQLRVLDVSGNLFYPSSAPAVALQQLLGSIGVDASSATSDPAWNVHSSNTALGGSYLALAPSDDGEARWSFEKLVRGTTYEVYASWHADTSHNPTATYTSDGVTIGTADQRIASSQRPLGEASLDRIGTFTADSDTVEISVGHGSGSGTTVADAILLRPVSGSPADSLVHLDLRGTVLSNEDRAVVLGEMLSRNGVLHVDDNESPVWSGLPDGISIDVGDTTAIEDLNQYVDDAENTTITFSATSSDPAVALRLQGSDLKISATSEVANVVYVEVKATDAAGLSSTITIPVAIGLPLISGVVADESDQPVEGATVNATSENGKVSTLTGRDGRYWILGDAGAVTLSVDLGQKFQKSSPDIQLEFSRPAFESDQNFSVTRGVIISGTAGDNEGDLVSLVASSTIPGGSYKWTVSGGPVSDVVGENAQNFQFKPTDSRVYTVLLEYSVNGNTYIENAYFSFGEVVGVASDIADITSPEGRFSETLTIIDDGGLDDTYKLSIHYGDGRVDDFASHVGPTFAFDHVYSDAGIYQIVILVGDNGTASESEFTLNVTETIPSLSIDLDEPFQAIEREGNLEFGLIDPSRSANRYEWQFSVDWGDGSPVESFNDRVSFTPIASGVRATFDSSHNYAEGTYTVTYIVVDDDGEEHTQTLDVVVRNAAPMLSLAVPSEVLEDELFTAAVSVVDDDTDPVVVWDFGDGDVPQLGETVIHRFSGPGEYVATVSVTDTDGVTVTRSHTITVTGVNDAPRLAPIPPTVITETFAWSLQVQVTDNDDDEVIVWNVQNAPAGLTISDSGLIQWTPTLSQGFGEYEFTVSATDSAGVTATARVQVDVVDTGSISGTVFRDDNGSGIQELGERGRAANVSLDLGNNGTIDYTTRADLDGRYSFENLAIGLYRVVVSVPNGFVATSPEIQLVDLSTPSAIETVPTGVNNDIDGDGVNNLDEQNSPAGVDGNGDGIADWQQGNVISVMTDGGPVTVVSPIGTLLNEVTVTEPAQSTQDILFPYDRISFTVSGVATGSIANVELIYGVDSSINAVFAVDESQPADLVFRQIGSERGERTRLLGDRVVTGVREGGVSDTDTSATKLAVSLQLASVDMGTDLLQRSEIGNLDKGIAVADEATGDGFIMHSAESVHSRFADASIPYQNSDHMVAVRFFAGSWQLNNNRTWINFTPRSSDRLIASVNFTNDAIESLQGFSGVTDGIQRGYLSGDLTFQANRWDNRPNVGEFSVQGTEFFSLQSLPPTVRIPIGTINRGIAVQESASGTGYVLLSHESVHTRFADDPPFRFNSDRMIVVRLNDSVWQYNDNQKWVDFDPRPSDRLIASVDMDADTITSLRDAEGSVGGIAQGYAVSDLTFAANVFNGQTNANEFTITGTYIEVDVVIAPTSFDLGDVNSGIGVHDDASGTGYVLYSDQPIADRFADSPGHANNSERLIAVQYQDGHWVYSDNQTWVSFIPQNSDRFIAKLDFSADTIESLQGQTGFVRGIQLGFTSGDLTFAADRFADAFNNGEFTVGGTEFSAPVLSTPTQSVAMGANQSLIAVQDDATGRGYLMYSTRSLRDRFGESNIFAGTADHVVAVRYQNGTWQWNDNQQWNVFTPDAGDRLLASVDFDLDTVAPMTNAVSTFRGISQGYVGGDLVFFANRFGPSPNSGEFTIDGSYFELPIGSTAETASRATLLDSNRDGIISASDALRIINRLAVVAEPDEFTAPPPFDPNADGKVTALDALMIINELARESSDGESEGWSQSENEALSNTPLNPLAVDRAIGISDDDDSTDAAALLF
ncbi:PKD domain-containing protein [Rubripirellula amarantea]|nr:PKD domain-containing protein [Rubripirellula amarantea]